MDENTAIAVVARAANLEVPEARLPALAAGLQRIEAASRWLDQTPLGFTEPALVFDIWAGGLFEPR